MEDFARKLIDEAVKVRKFAYSPYFKIYVGAALLTEDGSIVTGCNVENISGSAVTCAESNALTTSIAQGKRTFKALGLAGIVGEEEKVIYPCGVCLQKLSEFCPDLDIYIAVPNDNPKHVKLRELLPVRMMNSH